MKAMDVFMIASILSGLCVTPALALKVLLVPLPYHSHCNVVGMIGEALTKRGHSVSAYLPENWDNTRCMGGRGIDVIYYKMTREEVERLLVNDVYIENSHFLGTLEMFRRLAQNICSPILRDHVSLEMIKSLKFDVAVVDVSPCNRCYLLIPYKLAIPFVSESPFYSWFDTGAPFIPNMEPFPTLDYPDEMYFPQRVLNTLVTLSSPFLLQWLLTSESELKFAPELSFFEYISLVRQSKIYLQDDDVIIHQVLPVMPNVIHTGGFTPQDSKPLERELDEFYASANDGVIVVSLGTTGVNDPPRVHKAFMEVFTNLTQNILWKTSTEVNNTKIKTSTWIPQNDVLGHQNTRLFISHCGRNSFYETVYHAVPAICIPLFGDQPANAQRLHEKMIGIRLDPSTITTPLLLSTIKRVLTEQGFRDNITLLSAVYRDIHPVSAAEVSANAIEHVMKYDSNHLRPQSLSLSIPAVLMVDVWFVLLMALCCMVAVLCWCCVRFIRLCRRHKQKKD